MPDDTRQRLYREIPSVDELLERPVVRKLVGACSRGVVVAETRRAVEQVRREISNGQWDASSSNGSRSTIAEALEKTIGAGVDALTRRSLRRVINATGVILHTNLGRAPLSESAVAAIRETAAVYSNLEYDIAAGRRGKRDTHAGQFLERLLGAPAIVVNNNAAAVFLVLNELAANGEAIVSRGELIEIGDGFRIPDIMARGGARLREVGATNRTHITDYRNAIGPDTRLLLRVHPSNFRIVGFTARPTLEELVALGRERNIPVAEDLGSGCLYDVSPHGMSGEPPVSASLQAGADLVTFSGDKLLGGPQAGIIAGKPEIVARIRRNPLFRMLRVDKLTYAALEATLADYLFERYDHIPVLRMIRMSPGELDQRARSLAERLNEIPGLTVETQPGESILGGGSTPGQSLPTTVVAVNPPQALSPADLEQCLRQGDPAIIVRLEDGRVLIDPRTFTAEDEFALIRGFRAACGS